MQKLLTKIGYYILGTLFVVLTWIPAVGFCLIADWPGHWIVGLGFVALAVGVTCLAIGQIEC